MHISPLLPKMPQKATFTAASMSASGKTMFGDLPPSSRLSRFRFETPEASSRRRAVCDAAGEADLVDVLVQRQRLPGGRAVARDHVQHAFGQAGFGRDLGQSQRAQRRQLRGFSTTEQPQASAGATFQAAICSGKFHGTMAPTTPTGSRSV